MDQFYIILPSNVNIEGNKTSNFTVRLPNTVDLSEGDWYMALSSIIYPVSFNLKSEDMSIGIGYYDSKKEPIYINIPESTYESVEQLERTINETLLGSTLKPRKTRSLLPFDSANPLLSAKEQKELSGIKREAYNISLTLQEKFSQIETDYKNVLKLREKISKIDEINTKRNLLDQINNITSMRNLLRSDLVKVTGLKKEVDQNFNEKNLSSAKTNLEAMKKVQKNMEENNIKQLIDELNNNSILSPSIQEIKENLYKTFLELQTTLDENIIQVEGLTARFEYNASELVSLLTNSKDIEKEEFEEFRSIISALLVISDKNRNEAQSKRIDVDFLGRQYRGILHTINKEQANIEQLLDEAKDIIKTLNEDISFVDEKLKVVKENQEKLKEEEEEIKSILKPIDEGMKKNINRVKEEIMKKLTEDQNDKLEIYFHYDSNLGKFYLYNNKPKEIKWVSLSERIAYILGFELDSEKKIKGIRLRRGGGFAKGTPDISSGIHQLYVYMPNIIDYTYVGDKQTPLLRVVNIDKPINSIAESIYTNPHFIKVIEKRISSIKIEIRDLAGNFINFNWGNVIITLAVKRAFF